MARLRQGGGNRVAHENYPQTGELSLFLLDSASEILFSGDAGDTAASRPSRRYGIEWTNDYRPLSWLSLEADIAVTHARFRGDDPVGQF